MRMMSGGTAPQRTTKTVMLVANARSHFQELITVGCLLRDEEGWNPVFCFVGAYRGAEEDQRRCASEELRWVAFASAAPRLSWHVRAMRHFLSGLSSLAQHSTSPSHPPCVG